MGIVGGLWRLETRVTSSVPFSIPASRRHSVRASQFAGTDPPEVSYLLIIAPLADRSLGAKSDLRPVP